MAAEAGAWGMLKRMIRGSGNELKSLNLLYMILYDMNSLRSLAADQNVYNALLSLPTKERQGQVRERSGFRV